MDVLAGEVVQRDLMSEKGLFFCEFNSGDPGAKRSELLFRSAVKMEILRSMNVNPHRLLNLSAAIVFKSLEVERNFSLNNLGWDLAHLPEVQSLVGSSGQHLFVIVVEVRPQEVALKLSLFDKANAQLLNCSLSVHLLERVLD